MPKTVISDASCLIALSNAGELELLKQVYGEVTTTPEIALEFGMRLPPWIEVIPVKDKVRQSILELQIDKGESSAIALSLELPNCKLILDDLKARKVAAKLKIEYTGTLGVIIKAKLNGKIQSVIPIINALKKAGFHISEKLEFEAMKAAQEI